jgi:hypothetical protein
MLSRYQALRNQSQSTDVPVLYSSKWTVLRTRETEESFLRIDGQMHDRGWKTIRVLLRTEVETQSRS